MDDSGWRRVFAVEKEQIDSRGIPRIDTEIDTTLFY